MLYVISGVDFDNLLLFDPLVLSLSFVLKIHLREIHERPSGSTCLSGSDLSPASLLDFLALTFTSWCSPVIAFQLDLRQLWFSYCKAFEENTYKLSWSCHFNYIPFLYQTSGFLRSCLNPRTYSLQFIPHLVVLKSK